MSSSSLSLTKAKEIAINFIKKYKDSLRYGETGKAIDNEDIERFEMMSPTAFFNDVYILANFGRCFKLFGIRWLSNSKQALIWMGEHSNVNVLTKKIATHSASDEDLLHFWQMEGTWYNLTEARMEALEKIFDQLGANPKAQTAKKSSKKTAKKSGKKVAKKPEVVTISDTTEVQNEIAFIDFDADKFEHVLKTGGINFDPWIDNAFENSAKNQIDHAINAFKLAKKELDVFLTELVKAKDAGAKYVVDTSWCEREDFIF